MLYEGFYFIDTDEGIRTEDRVLETDGAGGMRTADENEYIWESDEDRMRTRDARESGVRLHLLPS